MIHLDIVRYKKLIGGAVGFYARNMLAAGPFRFSLTQTGVSVSKAVPGFPESSLPRVNCVRLGASGMHYYCTSIEGRKARMVAAQREASLAPDFPASSDILSDSAQAGTAEHLLPASSHHLVPALNKAVRRAPFTRWTILAILVLGLVTMPAGLFVLLAGVPLIWWTVLLDRARGSVVIFYDVGEEYARTFQGLLDAAGRVGQANGFWRLNESKSLVEGYQQKVNAGAASIVRRVNATFSDRGPRQMVTNISVPGVIAGTQAMYFLPDRILLFENGEFAEVAYGALHIAERDARFIESPGQVPADGLQVGETWQYVNKNGGPDRRFANNAILPVMKYANLEMSANSGFRWVLEVSNLEPAKRFVRELRAHASLAG